MKTKNLLLVAALLFMVLGNYSMLTAQISVIVSKSSANTASKSEIKDIFLGSKLLWAHGGKITVVDQSGSETGSTFYAGFLGKSVNQVRVQWTKLVLSGQASAPLKAATDEDVKKAVAANGNAIGYISSSSLDKSVKEIFKIKEDK